VKGGYEWKRVDGRGGLLSLDLDFWGEGSLGFGNWLEREFELGSRAKDQYRGHRFAGGFGQGGQDIHMVSWS
jgi:hypothetical protein